MSLVLGDLLGHPAEHRGACGHQPGGHGHQGAEEPVAAGGGQREGHDAPLVVGQALPLGVLAPERLHELLAGHPAGLRQLGQATLLGGDPDGGADRHAHAEEGDGHTEEGDPGSGHVLDCQAGAQDTRPRRSGATLRATLSRKGNMAKPYDPKDFYFRQAKKQGLRARSAFKIEEILRKQKLLGKGGSVLDLGAAPGGFLQILAEVVGPRGVAVGVDIVPIQRLPQPWVKVAVVDLLAPDALDRIRELHAGRFDLVTSDMAPKTTGVKITDEARSLELCRIALAVARETLKLGGAA